MESSVEAGADAVARAARAMALGESVLMLLTTGEETFGNLVFAAEVATSKQMAFAVRYTTGYVCVALDEADCDRLQLPAAQQSHPSEEVPAYAVAVDASAGTGTGISATDRAFTARLLADANATPADLTRPGHVVTLRARSGGVLRRSRGAEAAVDLARLAGLRPVGVLSTIVSAADGAVMNRREDLLAFAAAHGLAVVSIEQLVEHRYRNEIHIERVAETKIPTTYGAFAAIGYRENLEGTEYLAIVAGDVADDRPVLVRLQSECLVGDVFSSAACSCAFELSTALSVISAEGRGLMLYTRAGPGVPLKHDRHTSSADGERELQQHSTVSQILADLGVKQMRLLTTDTDVGTVTPEFGVAVTEQVPLGASPMSEAIVI